MANFVICSQSLSKLRVTMVMGDKRLQSSNFAVSVFSPFTTSPFQIEVLIL